MGPLIKELQEGTQIEGVYLLSACQVLTTKNGKPYGALNLEDSSGSIQARLWDAADRKLEGLKAGVAVKVRARVESFKGTPQLILNDISQAEGVDPASFMQASPVPYEEMVTGLAQAVGLVKHSKLKQLLKAIFLDKTPLRRGFLRAPAAKGAHHNYLHGLLEHTLSVSRMAAGIARCYPELNSDLLITGALIHDIGKTQELLLGPPIEYSDEGRLIGHVILGVRILDETIARLGDFPENLADALRHMILSHHGEYEFGSPKRPKTAEAMALHHADDLDAKLAMFRSAAEENCGETWSPFNRLLGRYLYVGPAPLGRDEPQEAPACEEAPAAFGLFDRPNGGEEY